MCQNEDCGLELWEKGGLIADRGVGERRQGTCRTVVIDVEKKTKLGDYEGLVRDMEPVAPGQLVVIWAEGGSVRLRMKDERDRVWSYLEKTWTQGECPRGELLETISAAMG
jgi:hypothetical protein